MGSTAVAFYLVLPIGWSGSSGCFAQTSSAIPKWHNAHDPSNPEDSGGESPTIFLFVEGGIIIAPNLGTRCEESAHCWEKERELTFGPNSGNIEKLDEEGNCETKKLALGYLLETDNWPISIPEAKIRGAQSLISPPYINP